MKRPAEIREKIPYREGEEVMLLVEEFTDLGINVIIDGRYEGLLYKTDVFGKLSVGDQLTGYIKKIRQDNTIDVMLRKGGLDDIIAAKDAIWNKLVDHHGFMPLSDDTAPEVVREKVQ